MAISTGSMPGSIDNVFQGSQNSARGVSSIIGRSVIIQRWIQGFGDFNSTNPPTGRSTKAMFTDSPMAWGAGRKYINFSEDWMYGGGPGNPPAHWQATWTFNNTSLHSQPVLPVITVGQVSFSGGPFQQVTSFSINAMLGPQFNVTNNHGLVTAPGGPSGGIWTSFTGPTTILGSGTITYSVSSEVDYNLFSNTMLLAVQWNPSTGHFLDSTVDAFFNSNPFSTFGQSSITHQLLGFNDPNFEQNNSLVLFGSNFPGTALALPDFSGFNGVVLNLGQQNPPLPLAFQFPPSYVMALEGDNRVTICQSQVKCVGSYKIIEYTVMYSPTAGYSLVEPILVRIGVGKGYVMIPPPGVTVSNPDTSSESWNYVGFDWSSIDPTLYVSATNFPIGKVRRLTQP